MGVVGGIQWVKWTGVTEPQESLKEMTEARVRLTEELSKCSVDNTGKGQSPRGLGQSCRGGMGRR